MCKTKMERELLQKSIDDYDKRILQVKVRFPTFNAYKSYLHPCYFWAHNRERIDDDVLEGFLRVFVCIKCGEVQGGWGEKRLGYIDPNVESLKVKRENESHMEKETP